MEPTLMRPDFQLMFESIPECALVLAPDSPRFTVLAATDAYLRATNKLRQNILGHGVFEVFSSDPENPSSGVVENCRASFEKVLTSRVPDKMAMLKLDISHPESEVGGVEERFWNSLNTPVLDGNNEVIGIIHCVEDVTEFVRLGQKDVMHKVPTEGLGTGDSRYRRLIDHLHVGLAHCRMIYDDRGRPEDFVYLAVNPAFNRLTGLRDVCGKRVTEVIPGIKETHPEIFETYSRVARSGEPERFEINFNLLNMWLDISVYSPQAGEFVAIFDKVTERKAVEASLRQAAADLEAANAQLRSSRAAALNLMEDADIARGRAEQAADALRESEEKLRSAFANAAIGFAISAPHGCFLDANPAFCRLTGYSVEELRTFGFRRIVHPDDLTATLERDEQMFAGKIPGFVAEDRYVRKDGSFVWVRKSVSMVRGADGVPRWIIVLVEDITKRRRAEEELQRLNESLERRVIERTAEVQRQSFNLRALATELTQAEQRERQRLARILHDHIQQLLVSAQIQLSLVKRGDLQIIQSVTQGVDSILTEALSASRSLTVELFPTVLYQSGLVAALSWLAARTEEKYQFRVHVRADNDAEPAALEMCAFLFEAVRELLLNAVKYSGVREAYLTMMRTSEDCCRIIIEDNGKGFDSATAKPGPSGGFGLFSIQQRLMHLGGRLDLESAPGQGTRAVLTIPIGKLTEDASAAGIPHEAGDGQVLIREKGRKISVLLVDDHQIMRQGLTSLLQFEDDIEVVGEAEDGRRALELAREHRPDVVIMDTSMPVMNGIDATKALTKEMPQIRVIGLSMYQDQDIANAMREAGAVAYLTKGGRSEELLAAIRVCHMSDRTVAPAGPEGTF